MSRGEKASLLDPSSSRGLSHPAETRQGKLLRPPKWRRSLSFFFLGPSGTVPPPLLPRTVRRPVGQFVPIAPSQEAVQEGGERAHQSERRRPQGCGRHLRCSPGASGAGGPFGSGGLRRRSSPIVRGHARSGVHRSNKDAIKGAVVCVQPLGEGAEEDFGACHGRTSRPSDHCQSQYGQRGAGS
jgi:hypothetical protein